MNLMNYKYGLVIWGIVIVLSGACRKVAQEKPQHTERSSIEERIAKCVGEPGKVILQTEFPTYRLPFLGTPSEETLTLDRAMTLPSLTTLVGIKLYFSRKGDFLRAESHTKIDDFWRKSVETIEHSMKGSGHAILGVPQPPEDFHFATMWTGICQRFDMRNAREFDLSLVTYQFTDGTIHDVIIMNVWGLNNPMMITARMPAGLKNRIRAFFNMEGKMIAADNLL